MRKRRSFGRKRLKLQTMRIPRNVYPDRVVGKFKGEVWISQLAASTAGTPLEYLYNGNCAFEPYLASANVTIVSSPAAGEMSCTGYTQIASQYSACTVLGSSIKVTICDAGTATPNNFALTVIPYRRIVTGTTTVAELNNIQEMNYAR